MNRTLLLTGFDKNMAYIGDLTSLHMDVYADRHGMDFRCERYYTTVTHPAWQKLGHVLRALSEGYEAVLWLDADMVITNPDCVRHSGSSGLHLSRDWGSDASEGNFSTGAFVAYADSLPIFEAAAARREFEWSGYYDQSALREAYAHCSWARSMVHVYPRRVFNSVPASTVGAVEPWEPGDFLCHLTGTGTIERRVEAFHEIVQKARVTN